MTDLGLLYHAIVEESRQVVQAHVEELLTQLTQIIVSSIASQEFKTTDPEPTARAVFQATVQFHHPAHASEWRDSNINADFDQVWQLVLAGLRNS